VALEPALVLALMSVAGPLMVHAHLDGLVHWMAMD